MTLVLGSYISGTDASLACSGWPLCNGSLVPGGDSDVGLHYLHRLVAGLLGMNCWRLIYLAFEERRAPADARSRFRSSPASPSWRRRWSAPRTSGPKLAADVVVTHLTLAALLWCLMVAVSALAFYLPGDEVEAASRRESSQRKETEWAR